MRWLGIVLCYVVMFAVEYIFSSYSRLMFFCVHIPVEAADFNFLWSSLFFSAVAGTEIVLMFWYIETLYKTCRRDISESKF